MRTGAKKKLAESLVCQTAYLSQVLNGAAHLSLEQAERANRFFSHSDEESHYFLILVQHARAGTKELRAYFKKQVERIQEERMLVANRLKLLSHLKASDQAVYYSAWYYSAIHMALTVEGLRNKAALGEYFHLPMRTVNRTLEFLLRVGLASQVGSEYRPGPTSLHLKQDSPDIVRHHSHWREQAIHSMDRVDPLDLHYSAAVTLFKKDAMTLRDRLLEQLREHIQMIEASPAEEVFCFNLDLFRLARKSLE